MKKYQFLCALSPSEIKSLFVDAYDTSKPLLLLLYDWLGINKGTFCRISEDRFWLYNTVPFHFFPKKHFSGALLYDEDQSKTKIIGRFVYSPWYLAIPLAVFLLFFCGPDLPKHISRLEYFTVCFLLTCLFVVFGLLFSRINMKPREAEILSEMEALLKNATKGSTTIDDQDYKGAKE